MVEVVVGDGGMCKGSGGGDGGGGGDGKYGIGDGGVGGIGGSSGSGLGTDSCSNDCSEVADGDVGDV